MTRPIEGETREQFIARVEAEAVHYPLPAGQNPDDPFYGGLNPANEADRAVIDSKIDPSSRITNPIAFIDQWIDRLNQTRGVLDASDRLVIGYIRRGAVQAIATLDDANASEDARRQAIMTLTRSAFDLGVIKRWVEQELWTKKALKKKSRLQTRAASKKRAKLKSPLIKARRDRLLEICTGWDKPIDTPGIAEQLAPELGVSVTTVYSDIEAIISASNDA